MTFFSLYENFTHYFILGLTGELKPNSVCMFERKFRISLKAILKSQEIRLMITKSTKIVILEPILKCLDTLLITVI